MLTTRSLANGYLQQLSVAPDSPSNGWGYYNTATNKVNYYINNQWQQLATESSSIANQIASAQTGNFWITGNGKLNGDLSVAATKKIYLDGGSNTYFTESSAGVIQTVVGGNAIVETRSGFLRPVTNNAISLGSPGRYFVSGHFTTSVFSPILYGSSSANQQLIIRTTQAASTSDSIVLQTSDGSANPLEVMKLMNGGKVRTAFLPTYANEAAASSLTQGDIYQTATGELRIKLAGS